MPSRDVPVQGIIMTQANENFAAALTEQGYPLKQEIFRLFNTGTAREKLEWQIEKSDVSFELPNHYQAHVDFVLKRRSDLPGFIPDNPRHVVMKCKRSTLDYDCWVFLKNNKSAHEISSNRYLIEYAKAIGRYPFQFKHILKSSCADQECPVFDNGIEMRIETAFNRHKPASSTVAIEDALNQVILGQTGLANKLHRTNTRMFQLIPVVVTTAKLMSAHLDDEKVSLGDDKLEPRKWVAINYQISGGAAQFFEEHSSIPSSIAQQLDSRRTVFVVQAEHIQPFLEWLYKKNL